MSDTAKEVAKLVSIIETISADLSRATESFCNAYGVQLLSGAELPSQAAADFCYINKRTQTLGPVVAELRKASALF